MALTNEDLEELFKAYDADGSGKIDVSELRDAVKAVFDFLETPYDDDTVEADVQVVSDDKSTELWSTKTNNNSSNTTFSRIIRQKPSESG